MPENLPQLLMRLPTLDGLESPSTPKGYELRPFRPGDEPGWCLTMDRAFEWETGKADFDELMRSDPCYSDERVKLAVVVRGPVVATASCWVVPKYGPEARMLHWVATRPDQASRGLGHQVSLAALHHAVGEGCTRAYLLTDDFRTAALKTYLRMGFEPVCTHASHPDRWRLILQRLEYREDFASQLASPLVSFD